MEILQQGMKRLAIQWNSPFLLHEIRAFYCPIETSIKKSIL